MDKILQYKAHRICSEHLGGAWSQVSPKDISLLPISGGMSNRLYRCSLPESAVLINGEPSQILLRLYGDQAKKCDMSIQLEIFNLLSMKELGPRLYGKFDDGRLEEFLPANSLTSQELMDNEISSIIAKKLAIVHSLDVPIDKNNAWLKERFNEWSESLSNSERGSWKFNDVLGRSTRDIARKLLAIDFCREIKFVSVIIDRTRSPIVFSHNDLHQGNILLARYSKRRPTLKERIVFIDFEYCSYNYRAYDIANHFCEWCFEYDTPDYPHFIFSQDKFPSKTDQRNFIRHYASQKWKLTSLSRTNSQPLTGSKNGNFSRNGSINGNRRDHYNGKMEEDMIMDEIKPFLMAANLLWTLWSIKSASNSDIEFGYWEHAMARWRLYSYFKASYSQEISEKENGTLAVQ